jgi:type VI secretion system secreted protein VgrG
MSAGRKYTVSTPLGDALKLVSMTGVERLGRGFSYSVQVLSESAEIATDDLLGLPATVTVESSTGAKRHFNGLIDRVQFFGAPYPGQWSYQFELVPWSAMLDKVADCRIFQEITVPDLLKKVFADSGFTDYELKLTRTYPEREYCVQYRETTLNFIMRLMEEEGIYFFFEHEESAHSMILVDDHSGHDPVPGQSSIKYHPDNVGKRIQEDSISYWTMGARVLTGQVALNAYNFETPRADISSKRLIDRKHAQASWEVFDFHDRYGDTQGGEHYVRNRIEELQADHEVFQGKTDSLQLALGHLFKLQQHPRGSQNQEYLLTEVVHTVVAPAYWSGTADAATETWEVDFDCTPSTTPFRLACQTPQPSVRGPQTAVVVGPPGEEIYPDKHGRIKVQFPWDRYGTNDQASSCWIRVVQSAAGPGFGAQFIPRIGHEVMVAFIEGDPDRPLVVGTVYNGSNAPPYGLPANKTQSGLKTRSSPGGGGSNANEIRLEDKKGAEEFYVQAEKDRRVLVKNCNSETVGADESLNVGKNRKAEVGDDETLSVGKNQKETVGVNQELNVGADRKRLVGNNETVTIANTQTETIGNSRMTNIAKADALNVGFSQEVSVGATYNLTVMGLATTEIGGVHTLEVGGLQSVSVDGMQTIEVGGDQQIEVGKMRAIEVKEDDSLKVGKSLVIEAADDITLKTGSASIVMKKNGDITIKGKNVTVKASSKISGKAGSSVKWKGSSVAEN